MILFLCSLRVLRLAVQLKISCSWQEKTKYVRSTYAHLQPYLLRCIFYCPFFDSFSIFRIFWCNSSYFWIILLESFSKVYFTLSNLTISCFWFSILYIPIAFLTYLKKIFLFQSNALFFADPPLFSPLLCSSPLCTRFLSYALLPSLLQLSYLIWIISHYLIIFLQALTAELAETTCERDRLHHKSQELKQALLVRGQVLRTIS